MYPTAFFTQFVVYGSHHVEALPHFHHGSNMLYVENIGLHLLFNTDEVTATCEVACVLSLVSVDGSVFPCV